MKSLLIILIIASFSSINICFAQSCGPIDNRNVGGGGTHAIICFFDAANLNLACIDCQLAGASGWKCGAGFNAVSGYHHATIAGAPCFSPVALPIELTSFSTENINESVNITWTTASERDNDYFQLESSRDGSYWQEVAIVKGAGNSSEKIDYSIIDKTPFYGTSYYRLTQYDINGAAYQLGTLTNELIVTKYLIYPVPVNKSMFLEGDNLMNSEILVVNAVGEIIDVEQTVVGDKISFNFSEVQNGAYFLTIENNKTKKTERISVVHK